MIEPTTAELTRRVERLERENRRWRRLAVLGLAGVAAAVAAGQTVPWATAKGVELPLPMPRKAPDVVEAQQFVLRDKSGVMRATLAISHEGAPVLVLLDENERTRAALAQSELLLSGGESGTGVKLFVNPDGRPALRLEQNGKLRAVLGTTVDGILAFGLYDRDGQGRALLNLEADGSPGLTLFSKSGKVTWSAR